MIEKLHEINLRLEEIKSLSPTISLVWERIELEELRNEIVALINAELDSLKEGE